ncbi:UBA-like_superfamily [Hexamita inflata]|uniref:UBA-like superfamily n=1 Tax=Hexamita inflata TaxID=28002 RepID=A0AA86REX5_9EUKA|nr:UBA-like superfamily [Hexamita inflata]
MFQKIANYFKNRKEQSKQEKVNSFIEFTNQSVEQSQHYLEQTKYDVQQALEIFFTTQEKQQEQNLNTEIQNIEHEKEHSAEPPINIPIISKESQITSENNNYSPKKDQIEEKDEENNQNESESTENNQTEEVPKTNYKFIQNQNFKPKFTTKQFEPVVSPFQSNAQTVPLFQNANQNFNAQIPNQQTNQFVQSPQIKFNVQFPVQPNLFQPQHNQNQKQLYPQFINNLNNNNVQAHNCVKVQAQNQNTYQPPINQQTSFQQLNTNQVPNNYSGQYIQRQSSVPNQSSNPLQNTQFQQINVNSQYQQNNNQQWSQQFLNNNQSNQIHSTQTIKRQITVFISNLDLKSYNLQVFQYLQQQLQQIQQINLQINNQGDIYMIFSNDYITQVLNIMNQIKIENQMIKYSIQ